MAEAILFDLDGTLVDTAGDLIDSLNLLLTKYGKEPMAYQQLRPYASDGSKGLIREGFAITEENPHFPVLREEYLSIYQQILHETDRPPHLFDGVPELLAYLNENIIPWGIVTNKPRYLTETLINQSETLAENHVLVCGDDVKPKPHPDSLLAASRKLGITAGDCIYVGDHQRDIIAGRTAGMKTITVAYGYTPDLLNIADWHTDYIVQSMHQIRDILIKL